MRRLGWLIGVLSICTTSARAQPAPAVKRLDAPRTSVRIAPLKPGSVQLRALPEPSPERSAADAPARTVRRPSGALSPTVVDKSSLRTRIGLDLKSDAAGRDLGSLHLISKGAARVSETASGQAELELPRDTVAVVSSSEAKRVASESKVSSDEKTPLPWLAFDRDPRASDTSDGVRTMRPVLELADAIRWDPALQRHAARFWFGLDVEQGQAGPLAAPIHVLFSATCDSLVPSEIVKLEASGIQGYAHVDVHCSPNDKSARSKQELKLRLDDGELTFVFEIPTLFGTPTLVPSHDRLTGFGMSTLELTVQLHEENGSILNAPNDLPVVLRAERGELHLSQLVIKKGTSSGTLQVRPRGMAALRLSARVAGKASPPIDVSLHFPVLIVAVALLGGILGGALAWLPARAKGRVTYRLLEGAGVGLLIATLSFLVPSFSTLGGIVSTSELAIFVVAALAGVIGSPLLDQAARALFPAQASAPSAKPQT